MPSGPNKITVQVSPGLRKQNISVRTVGQFGDVNLSGLTLDISGNPLTAEETKEAYWKAVLTQVLSQIS